MLQLSRETYLTFLLRTKPPSFEDPGIYYMKIDPTNVTTVFAFEQDLLRFEMRQSFNWEFEHRKPLKHTQSLSIQDAFAGLETTVEIERTLINTDCVPQICPHCGGRHHMQIERNDFHHCAEASSAKKDCFSLFVQSVHTTCPFCRGDTFLSVNLTSLFCPLLYPLLTGK